MSARKVCLNFPTSYYTGKEQSPLHFGLSAEGYEINSIMEGFDKDLWIVEVRNNKKVWTKKEHINKMTFEIPLITESTPQPLTPLTPLTQQKEKEQQTQPTSSLTQQTETEPEQSLTQQQQQSQEPEIAPPLSPPSQSDVVVKEKVSKTVKPTDYTLFITYRIHQMKEISGGDNKKNYDTARYEWKEYKNKPDELRLIMVEANHYHGIVNKK
jgi:hypothetical protein